MRYLALLKLLHSLGLIKDYKPNQDPFESARNIVIGKRKHFNWKIYVFVPLLVALVSLCVCIFSPIADWFIPGLKIFDFSKYDPYDSSMSLLFFIYMFFVLSALLSLIVLDYIIIKESGYLKVNPFTYLNYKLYSYFFADNKDEPVFNPSVIVNKKIVDDSQAYQYTGKRQRKNTPPSSPPMRAEKSDELETTELDCPNFDLPEFDPDGPNPFSKN